ncbi:MAG: sodium:calcium antiporter [Vampirovibrionales bacterium]
MIHLTGQLSLEIGLILVMLVLIVGVCQVFSNAVEWLGEKLQLSDGVVGSVLAAVGTALPETIVPLVALLGSGAAATLSQGHQAGVTHGHGEEIGIGAILGAPFMLITLGMVVIGTSITLANRWGKRDTGLKINPIAPKRDLFFFSIAYLAAFGAGLLPQELHLVRHGLAFFLFAWYFVYLTVMLKASKQEAQAEEAQEKADEAATHESHLSPLYFAPKQSTPSMGIIVGQIAVALIGLIVLAHQFVGTISQVATELHVPAFLLSLIIVPIATELPEKFNSFIWCQQDKDTLAVGNMTGAMVFQSCWPVSVGLLLTPWQLNTEAMVNVALCMLCSLWMYLTVFARPERKGAALWLLTGAVFYIGYIVYMLNH